MSSLDQLVVIGGSSGSSRIPFTDFTYEIFDVVYYITMHSRSGHGRGGGYDGQLASV